ncbi:MAG: DUF4838 domain-containing protein [Pontixanthobacter sp.]
MTLRLYTLAIAAMLVALIQPAQAQTFVRDGEAVATIYVPANGQSDGAVAIAARELNYHFEKMSGASLDVVATDDAKAIRGPAIVLGQIGDDPPARQGQTTASGEAFRLLTRGDRLFIGGESDAAILMGVYSLLERIGVDWVMPGTIGEIIPERATIAVAPLDETQAPDFAMRRLWYRGGRNLANAEERGRFAEWLRRQKGGVFEPVAHDTRGHYWDVFIRKHREAFDADPTMYALRPNANGQLVRAGPQIESTHPRIAPMMAQDIRDAFARNGWPNDKAVGFPIGPADGAGFSQSAEAQAAGSGRFDVNSGVPDQTDHLVLLANRIFAELGDDYPNVHLGYYSYAAHGDYPVRYRPHPRLVQIFAPINFSRYHSIIDPLSDTQADYRTVFDQWTALSQEQGNPLLYRGYNWNLAENMLPHTKLRIWGEELPYYAANGIGGLNVEATKAWAVNGPGDWLFMKLAWDASQDWRALLREYTAKSFGSGAAPMERHFLRLAERQHSAAQEAGSYHAIPLIFDRAFAAAARRDVEEAIASAALPDQKTRAAHFLHTIGALDLYLDYYEATLRFDFAEANAAFAAMHRHWETAYAQNSDLVAREGPDYLDRFIRPFVEAAATYSASPYALTVRLPDALPTAFASREDGERLGYHRRDPVGTQAAFTDTATYSTTWDDQGLTRRGGSVWYRFRMPNPDLADGRALSLFLGGFDDTATVWVNGTRVGTSKGRFSEPAIFDLSGHTTNDADITIAIHIDRADGINEIGVGGLFRPSFLFTGPAPQS